MIRNTHLRQASAILIGCAALALVGCVPSGYVRDYPQYRSYPNSGYIGGYYPNSGYSGGYYPNSGYSGGYYPYSGYPGGYYPGSSYYGYTNRYFFDGYYPGRYYGFVPHGYYWNGLYPYPYRPRHPRQGHDGQDDDHDGQGSGGQGSDGQGPGGDGSGSGRPRQGGHLPVRDAEPGLVGTSPKAPYIRNPDIKRQQASPRQEGSPVAGKARNERPMRANQSQSETREVRNTREVREPREARSDTRDITGPIVRQLPSGVGKP